MPPTTRESTPIDRSPARSSIAFRLTILCLVVAAIAVLVAGVLTERLVSSSAQDATLVILGDQADVLVTQVDDGTLGAKARLRRAIVTLQEQGIAVVLRDVTVPGESTDPAAIDAAQQAGLSTVTPETPSSAAVKVDGKTLLVVTRSTSDGIGFSLVRPASSTVLSQGPLLLRILVALIVGMVVAAIAAVLLARRLARPLRDTARVATSMAHGQRDLRVTVDGPLEVADVATAVNSLADSLHESEQRQRDFLLSVSHELRTPLTAVTGFAESLADGVVTGDAVPAVARTISSEAGRLDRLVSDLLDLARLGADDFRLDVAPVDVSALVADAAIVWAHRAAAAGLSLTTDIATAQLIARTDPRRLRQIIDGLAENAVRLTPAGAQVVMALYATPGHAVIQVRDAGPGLSAEDYQVAFQRGALRQRYEGHRRVGTGIGLSLVQGLVIRLDATISAGPAPEGGASFTVVLPLAAP